MWLQLPTALGNQSCWETQGKKVMSEEAVRRAIEVSPASLQKMGRYSDYVELEVFVEKVSG